MKVPQFELGAIKLTPRTKKIIAWVAYPMVYLFMFVCFAYWTFPYEKLKQKIIVGYAASQRGNPEPKRMQIEDVTWSWRFPGVVLSDIQLIGPKPKQAGASDKKPPKRMVISIDEAYAGVSVFSLLFGTTEVTFDVDGFGGEMSGSFSNSDEATQLSVEFEEVDPGQLPGLTDALGLPLAGAVSGEAELTLPEGKYAAAEGTVNLQIASLEVGDGVKKIRDLFALPTIQAGDLTIEATASQGRVKLEKFEASGPDLEVYAEGKIRLRDPVELSAVEQINLSFKFTDQYKNKSEITQSLLGKPNTTQRGMIDMDPKVKRAKADDGAYYWRVAGRFSQLNFVPNAAAAKAPKSAEAKPAAAGTSAGPPRTPAKAPAKAPRPGQPATP